MRFCRICRRRYVAEAASGEGARRYGGRWNSQGVRMVYASTSLSLAAVETFVHLEPNLRPADLVSIEGDIPDAVQTVTLDVQALPADWYETRDESLHRFGDHWIRDGRSATLLVPSAAIRGEWNVLVNPAHAEFSKIEFRDPEPFEFDARMFRSALGQPYRSYGRDRWPAQPAGSSLGSRHPVDPYPACPHAR